MCKQFGGNTYGYTYGCMCPLDWGEEWAMKIVFLIFSSLSIETPYFLVYIFTSIKNKQPNKQTKTTKEHKQTNKQKTSAQLFWEPLHLFPESTYMLPFSLTLSLPSLKSIADLSSGICLSPYRCIAQNACGHEVFFF